jgi:hypothetical protein
MKNLLGIPRGLQITAVLEGLIDYKEFTKTLTKLPWLRAHARIYTYTKKKRREKLYFCARDVTQW